MNKYARPVFWKLLAVLLVSFHSRIIKEGPLPYSSKQVSNITFASCKQLKMAALHWEQPEHQLGIYAVALSPIQISSLGQ